MPQTFMIKCLPSDSTFWPLESQSLQKVYFSRLNLNQALWRCQKDNSRNHEVPVRKFISHIWTILTKFPTLLCFPFFFENLSILPNHGFLLRVLILVWKNKTRLSLLSWQCHTVDLVSVGGVKFLLDFKRTLEVINANRKCQVGSRSLNFTLKSDKIQEPDILPGCSGGTTVSKRMVQSVKMHLVH